jgi:uncharacterized protein
METPEHAFMSAVYAGDLEKVRSLVERNPRLVEAQRPGATALGSAAMWRRVAIVRYLLDNGADANRRPSDGENTPLAEACLASRPEDEILEVVLLLLERGADASLPGRDGVTPLMIASWGGYARVVEALLVHGCGNVDQQHSEVDSDGRQNTTALLRAFCDDEYVDVARLLLRAGADPTIADGEGETFVAIASREGYDDSRALYQVRAYAIHGRSCPPPPSCTWPLVVAHLCACVYVLCVPRRSGSSRTTSPRPGGSATPRSGWRSSSYSSCTSTSTSPGRSCYSRGAGWRRRRTLRSGCCPRWRCGGRSRAAGGSPGGAGVRQGCGSRWRGTWWWASPMSSSGSGCGCSGRSSGVARRTNGLDVVLSAQE